MLTAPLLKALNEQINHEMFSSYLYLSMAAYCEAKNFSGFAQWMRMQSSEETKHAMKLYEYVHSRGSAVTLLAIAQPPTEFHFPVKMFEQVVEHERKISGSITKLYELAIKENDYPTQVMLQWFITEQVEEEKTAVGIVEQLKMVGDSPVSIMMMDRQLGARSNG
ncbi:MAG: ferritin [Bacteroidota bacterium]|nr:ferritin [Bacteroidota bacterium]